MLYENTRNKAIELSSSPDKLTFMKDLVFEVIQEEDGGYCAECLTENIFTQGDTWEQLRNHVREAVKAYYFDRPDEKFSIRLHLVKDEVLA